jgi:tetratricopeptide (TPR) repeat protein
MSFLINKTKFPHVLISDEIKNIDLYIQYFKNVKNNKDNDDNYYNFKGYCNYNNQNINNAIKSFETALQFKPINKYALYNIIYCLLEVKNYKKLESILNTYKNYIDNEYDSLMYKHRLVFLPILEIYGYYKWITEQNMNLLLKCHSYAIEFDQLMEYLMNDTIDDFSVNVKAAKRASSILGYIYKDKIHESLKNKDVYLYSNLNVASKFYGTASKDSTFDIQEILLKRGIKYNDKYNKLEITGDPWSKLHYDAVFQYLKTAEPFIRTYGTIDALE